VIGREHKYTGARFWVEEMPKVGSEFAASAKYLTDEGWKIRLQR
jgi:hypothetical protein